MNTKRFSLYALVALFLAALFYLQFRTWRGFDWSVFLQRTANIKHHLLNIFFAVAFIYFAYLLRAVRWRIFLLPVKRTSTRELIAPTIIGFTGLALLGRPGEFIRPYLISRKVNLGFSSQLAVWTVERIFDLGSFAVLFTLALLNSETRALLHGFHIGGIAVAGMVGGLTALTAIILKGETLANWVARLFSHRAEHLGNLIAVRIREFRAGLNTIHGFPAFVQLVIVSVVMWTVIGFSYWQVMLSYGEPVLNRPRQVPIVMASSMLGSMIQLPGVGGGSQLATIFTLQNILHVPRELAASCGILLWMVTFMAIIPVGLALAQHERLSLRKLSKESHAEEVKEELAEG